MRPIPLTRSFILLVLAAAALAACAAPAPAPLAPSATPPPTATATPTPTPPPTPSPTPAYQPLYEEAECRFIVPGGVDVTCGDLTVPENRADPGGRQVSMHVAVFHSAAEEPAPDPVVHLVGGPGGSLLDSAAFYLQAGGRDILQTRDYILFNQRGTAYAVPDLSCRAYTTYAWRSAEAALEGEEDANAAVAALEDCYASFVEEGIDLTAYNSAEIAADVNDLRAALGYQQVNLYGISYGSRLALTVMRDYPEIVRSAILDSVYPPQVNLYTEIPANADRAFTALFEACEQDEACRETYPNLRAAYDEAVAQLDAAPVRLPVFGPDRRYIVQVNGSTLTRLIFSNLYRADAIPLIPFWIEQARSRQYDALARPLSSSLGFGASVGMYMSVQCREEIPFEDEAVFDTLADRVPESIVSALGHASAFRVCELWDIEPALLLENQAVESDVPALVLSGSFDPITPPEWAQLAAESLPNSFFYEVPIVGHGVIRSNRCALSIALEFLDDPTQEPSSACLDALDPVRFR